MSLAHWNSFLLLKKNNHPIHQRGDRCRPQTRRHICSAASPCWLLSRGGGRCQRWMLNMSSAICLIYLCRWIFMRFDTGVSLQPAVQRQPAWATLRSSHELPPTSQRCSSTSHFSFFLFQFVCVGWRGGVLLSRSGTSQRRHPAMKKGGVGGGGERV